MREIALDTETTGLDPKSGDRIVEIGCVEMMGHMATGRSFQVYINPERDMPDGAFRVHGLSSEFLSDKPVFADVVDDFLAFLEDSPLVIHNATFDLGFINAELERVGHAPIQLARTTDTIEIARRKFPGSPANLDALCKRFGINLAGRELHGALLDARLLADVYLELVGGREPGLALSKASATAAERRGEAETRSRREARPHAPSADELARHKAFLEKITDPLWSS